MKSADHVGEQNSQITYMTADGWARQKNGILKTLGMQTAQAGEVMACYLSNGNDSIALQGHVVRDETH